MSWFLIAILAYFINAINVVFDKYLLSGRISHPLIYTFYIGLLSIFALIFAPFGLYWPGFFQFFLSLLVGAVFLGAIMTYFFIVKRGEASRVAPVIGGFTPIFVFFLSYLLLGERLGQRELFAFVLLIAGGILISLEKSRAGQIYEIKSHVWNFALPLLSAFLFALFYVGVKFIFTHQDFISGFIWTRMGSFLAALLLLVPAKNRKIIFPAIKVLEAKTGVVVILNKTSAGLAFLLQNYAIALGSVILVNAMRGTQYVFLLAIALILSKEAPWILEEKIDRLTVFQKSLAVLLICAGLVILAF